MGLSVQASGQSKGDMAIGGGLAYGTSDGFSNFGIGAKFQYNFSDKLRVEPSFTYFLKKDYITMWDLSANLHYLFPVSDQFSVYPLAGLAFVGIKATVDMGEYGSASASESELGFNLGGGAQYWISETLALNLDIKYQIVSNMDRPVFGIGCVYKF